VELLQVVGRLAGAVVGCRLTFVANWATVKPLGAGPSASTTVNALRMRGVLMSTPPTFVLPTYDGDGAGPASSGVSGNH